MSKENSTQAAANKAAEEGGLPALPKAKMLVGQHLDSLHVLYSAEQVRDAQRAAIASDRASRQVANKKEVEPVAWAIKSDGSFIFASVSKGAAQGWLAVAEREILPLYATSPATTGASTARLESILDRLDDAIGGYSGGPFDKVLAIIDELRSAPDCGACPGDGSMCKSRCKVEQESPASTVLTDERLTMTQVEAIRSKIKPGDGWDGDNWDFALANAVAREVAAQAGQVAVPGWLPIESVPTDGQEVLLYLGKPYDRVVKARWFDLWENWIEGEFPDPQDEYCGIGSSLPTHWMPVPPSPAKVSK